MSDNSSMITCERCGKKLIERKGNGTWVFKFGKRDGAGTVVHMEVYGSIRLKCLRRSCEHINVLNFFPSTNPEQEEKGTD